MSERKTEQKESMYERLVGGDGPYNPEKIALRYSGNVYIRPLGRGVVLKDLPGEPEIDDLVSEGNYYAEIIVKLKR